MDSRVVPISFATSVNRSVLLTLAELVPSAAFLEPAHAAKALFAEGAFRTGCAGHLTQRSSAMLL